jgi:hypothetical protein
MFKIKKCLLLPSSDLQSWRGLKRMVRGADQRSKSFEAREGK